MKMYLIGLIVVLMSSLSGTDYNLEEVDLGYKECYHDIIIEDGRSINCILKKIVKKDGEFLVFIEKVFTDGTQSREKFSVEHDCVENIIAKLDEVGFLCVKPVTPTNFPGIDEDDSEAIFKIYRELRLGQNNLFFFGKYKGLQVEYNVYDIEMVVDGRYIMIYKLLCDFFDKFK